MASREAFLPLFAAANSFSHDFNSSRKVFDLSVNSARLGSSIAQELEYVSTQHSVLSNCWSKSTRRGKIEKLVLTISRRGIMY